MTPKPAAPPAVETLTPEQVRHMVLTQYAAQLRRIARDDWQAKARAEKAAA